MYRFPTILKCLTLICASILIIYFSNVPSSFTWDSSNFDTRLSSVPLVQLWNRDNSTNKFCVWFNFTNAIKLSSNSSISLCTHGTIGYSTFIFDHARHWSDLISVSFLLDDTGFYALRAFQKLQRCIPEAAEKISSHLVWRAENETACSASFITQGLSNLSDDPEPSNCNLDDHINAGLFNHTMSTPYPPNSLRNIARNGASTSLHLIADIENHFSLNSSEILSISAAKNVNMDDKVAVIIRRFEYNNTSFEPPRTISQLNELMNNKQAFEFHHFLYAVGHRVPGLKEWLNYSLTPNTVPIVTTVKYQGNEWEPQLVVHSSYPYHFEGFPIRLHDQQALPYELCRAGYTFAVASHVFSFHKGIKISPSTKEKAAQRSASAVASTTGVTNGVSELRIREGEKYVNKSVEIMEMKDLLDKYVGSRVVHYMTIDIEGFEYTILEELLYGKILYNQKIVFCQIDAELHGEDKDKAANILHKFDSYASAYIPIYAVSSLQNEKVTWINIKNEECKKAFEHQIFL